MKKLLIIFCLLFVMLALGACKKQEQTAADNKIQKLREQTEDHKNVIRSVEDTSTESIVKSEQEQPKDIIAEYYAALLDQNIGIAQSFYTDNLAGFNPMEYDAFTTGYEYQDQKLLGDEARVYVIDHLRDYEGGTADKEFVYVLKKINGEWRIDNWVDKELEAEVLDANN